MPGSNVKVILASQSKARQDMLHNCGLVFEAIPADIAEEEITEDMRAGGKGAYDIAQELAKKKALAVSKDNPEALVIGSDQILEFEDELLDKATNREEAIEKLKLLRGKTHRLFSAVVVAKGDLLLWSYTDDVVLTMRDFNDDFCDAYCEKARGALTRSVGAYELEAHGAWLFSEIDGNYFTILGMPLLPLLTYLQDYHGVRP